MSMVTLVERSIFAERYEVVRCLASGGMGAIYEVMHLETDRRRALKVMHPHFLQSDELRARFRQEARVVAHIQSEFIVDVFDAGIDSATQMPFLVMELLQGEELGKLLKMRGTFTPAEAVTYLYQTALALDKTHRAKIVHRDLKPENLFLTHREDGTPHIKVLDFGIAKVVAESGTNANATRSLGTPLYMAPEQFRQGHKVSPATDLYALGMVAYTLLVGKSYWTDEAQADSNVFAFASAAMNGPVEHATERARRAGVPLPPAFDIWFAKATALNPEDRFGAASELVASLAEALGVPRPGLEQSGAQRTSLLPATQVLPTQAITSNGLTASVNPPPRSKGLALGLSLGVGLTVALAVTAVLLWRSWSPSMAAASAPAGETLSNPEPVTTADAVVVAAPDASIKSSADAPQVAPAPQTTATAIVPTQENGASQAAAPASVAVPKAAATAPVSTAAAVPKPRSTTSVPSGRKPSLHVRD